MSNDTCQFISSLCPKKERLFPPYAEGRGYPEAEYEFPHNECLAAERGALLVVKDAGLHIMGLESAIPVFFLCYLTCEFCHSHTLYIEMMPISGLWHDLFLCCHWRPDAFHYDYQRGWAYYLVEVLS